MDKKWFFLGVCFFPFLVFFSQRGASQETGLVLAGAGARSAIIIADQDPPYRFPFWGGHTILQRYLKLITGADVPVVRVGSLKEKNLDELYNCRIWMGTQPRVTEVLGEDLKRIDDDGFIIRAKGKDLFICGKHIWGTHYAAYELLERFAGCRWYGPEPRFWMPQEDGMIGLFDHIPKRETVTVPGGLNLVVEPSFRMRWMRHMPRHSFRMRQRDKYSHALVGIIPPEKYGQTHPEFFPEIDGKRYVPPPERKYDFQPCISNPEVVKLVAGAAIDYFQNNPEEGSFSVGMNDSNRYCQCARCQALAPASLTDKNQRIAYAFFSFYNAVAEQVARVYPEKRLGCLAYATLSTLPEGILKLHPMIVPYLTRDSAQLFDPDEVAEFTELVHRWSRLASRMGVYEYVYGRGFIIPRIYHRYLIKNIKQRYGVGCDGFVAEDYPNWGLDGPKYWLIATMLWNNQQDEQSLLDEYYRNMFGPAADMMKQYFQYLEEVWCTQTLTSTRSNYRWLNDARQLQIFTPEKCDFAWSLLEKAAKLAATARVEPDRPAVAERVNFFKTSFALTRLLSHRYSLSLKLADWSQQENMPEEQVFTLLKQWFTLEPLRKTYDKAMALKNALYPMEYEELRHYFDRSSGTIRVIHRLIEEIVSQTFEPGKGISPEEVNLKVMASLKEKKGLGDGHLLEKLRELVKTGYLFVRQVKQPPVIDGEIHPEEWGEPAYSGHFFEVFSVDDQSPYSTTVWAVENGEKLFLAFDCQGDVSALGGQVTGINTDSGAYPRMLQDDTISVNFHHQGFTSHVVRVNINNALQDSRQVTQARVSRTKQGWQV
ncbi:MAG TPA: DUF4838 domain-containing protein, partial [bacterium]|nr:DUF4838 domain-containing protein [bacterium]